MADNKKKILLVGNCYTTIASFRRELVIELVKLGYDVYVAFPEHSHGEIETGEDFAKEVGCHFLELRIERRSKKILKEVKAISELKKILVSINPDCVLTFTIKPNIYMGYLCKKRRIPYIMNITGLGSGLNDGTLRWALLLLYKNVANGAEKVLFQNKNDYQCFAKGGYKGKNAIFVPGSGVNLHKYLVKPYPKSDPCCFLFTARVMREKGIDEFIEAAKAFGDRTDISFEICGDCEEKYDSVLKKLSEEGVIVYHGRVSDVIPYLEKSSCVIIPTFYNEGISNCLLEAAAIGRPIITTDRPGSRETVDDGISGFLVEEKNADSLIAAIKRFLDLSYFERETMGIMGRNKIEKEFNREIVIDIYLKLLGDAID